MYSVYNSNLSLLIQGATEACAKAEWSAVKRGVMELAPDSPPGVQCVKLLSATPSQVLRLITASERSQLETQRSTLAEEEVGGGGGGGA